MESDTTSHPRQSILTSFLSRGSRPRSSVNSPTTDTPAGAGSQGININIPGGGGASGNRRRAGGGALGVASPTQGSTSPSASLPPNSQMPMIPGAAATSFSQMLRRRRSNNGPLAPSANTHSHNANASANANGAANGNVQASSATSPVAPNPTGPAHRIRLVPHLENSRALHFEPITRECREAAPPIRIGRFTDRTGTLAASTNSLTGKIAFKSKVVSRGHAEIWCEANSKFYIKDTSSSSGTFLNHMRLSHAGVESRPFLLKDGDILQLGVDYQGGTEEIYRCVKIRVEIGREWQAGPNPFNTSALAQLRSLSNLPSAAAPAAAGTGRPKTGGPKAKMAVSDCCICLFPVTVCQALFIAPCSHSFHYKCIRGTLWEHHPGFSCPLCRSFHDLEADVEHELPQEEEEWEDLPEEDPAEVSVVNPESAAAQAENDNPRPASARSLDDDDLPLRTAAEDNDRRVLLPQSHTTPTPNNRRNSRRGTANGQDPGVPPHPPATVDDTDRGFETDGAVMGYGAETDMDLDDPHPRHGGRSSSARNRSTIYNLVHASTLPPGPNGSFHGNTYAGSAGMNSAPNLLRPSSALGHAHHGSHGGNEGTGLPGTSTPPIPYMSASVNFRPSHGNSETPSRPSSNGNGHGLGHVSRPSLSGSLQGTSSASHLFGDAGAGSSAGPAAMDKANEGVHEEDHTIEGSMFGLGGKRKR